MGMLAPETRARWARAAANPKSEGLSSAEAEAGFWSSSMPVALEALDGMDAALREALAALRISQRARPNDAALTEVVVTVELALKGIYPNPADIDANGLRVAA